MVYQPVGSLSTQQAIHLEREPMTHTHTHTERISESSLTVVLEERCASPPPPPWFRYWSVFFFLPKCMQSIVLNNNNGFLNSTHIRQSVTLKALQHLVFQRVWDYVWIMRPTNFEINISIKVRLQHLVNC